MKCPLLFVLLLLLSSCAVTPQVEQSDPIATKGTIQQGDHLGKILHEQALQQLEEAHPQAYVLYEQARAAELLGQLDIAIETYHKAMQEAPEHGLLLSSLGMAYLRMDDMIPARRYILKSVNIDPDYYKSRLGLGYLYLQNHQLQKAITQLEASLQLLPTLEGTFLLAEAEEAQGNLSRARQLYQTVVEVDKNSKLGTAATDRLRNLLK
ncbi:MAG: tetratricopeptide repeat protein [Desulfuromusa sp.]|nr:tetratricopeptide repeat protein [Desulfuromusa sp.]